MTDVHGAMDEHEPSPFYRAACGYCERHGLDSAADVEQVRLSIAAGELTARMQGATELLVENRPAIYTPNGELPPAYRELERQVAGLRAELAAELGLGPG